MKKDYFRLKLSKELPPPPGVTMERVAQIFIPKNYLIRIEGDSRGVEICCRQGSFWITQEKDARDYTLAANEKLQIQRKGLVLIFALQEGLVSIKKVENKI